MRRNATFMGGTAGNICVTAVIPKNPDCPTRYTAHFPGTKISMTETYDNGPWYTLINLITITCVYEFSMVYNAPISSNNVCYRRVSKTEQFVSR